MTSNSNKYGAFKPLEQTNNNEYEYATRQSKPSFLSSKKFLIVLFLVLCVAVGFTIFAIFQWVVNDNKGKSGGGGGGGANVDGLHLFSDQLRIEYYAQNVNQPRQMQVVEYDGAVVVYVVGASPVDPTGDEGVFALIDVDSDHINDHILKIFVSADEYIPTSVVYDDTHDRLYVTQYGRTHVCRASEGFGNLNEELIAAAETQVLEYLINDNCELWFEPSPPPYNTWHGTHVGAIDPLTGDYCMSFGSHCNICEVTEDRFPEGTILCFDIDRPSMENATVAALGNRDSMGIDFHPLTHEMWFADHNRDGMGDNQPDCELNHLSFVGEHFGFPYCHSLGSGLPELRDAAQTALLLDPDFGDTVNGTCDTAQFTPAIQALGPHVAPLGMIFYTGTMFDAMDDSEIDPRFKFENAAIFIAEHGSWDRSAKIGFRVSVVFLSGELSSTVIGYEVFADGWLDEETQTETGRPTYVEMLPDGSLLIATDEANTIYRVTLRT